ncbi:MAG: 16S rRNA (cytosine967-C5)-methyltransferase [Planctomycetota bacterium]|jgi:16S rRNA (cytosine967-C5)-methyltransferase
MTRGLAWEILRSGSTAPTRDVAGAAERAGLDSRDRGLLARIVRTDVQRRGTLQAIVRTFAKGKPSRDLTAFLRIGFVQLFFMDRVPGHAAVSETVGAASRHLGLAKGRYVNGVLRTAKRAISEEPSGDPRRDLVGRNWSFNEPIFHDPEEHYFLWAEDALSLPATLFKSWHKRYGKEKALELANACLEDPHLSLRVVQGTREELQAELLTHEVPTTCGEHPLILTATSDLVEKALATDAFREGRITVQGEAAYRAAEFCEAGEGERWLDLCAAPGGKTAVLAAAGAKVTACDLSEAKLDRLTDTLARLKLLENVETLQLAEDGSGAEGEFDGVLLDVPCSNTGVLARRPEARWRWGPQSRKGLAELQNEILRRGAQLVRPGGKLVYSTCSIEPDENEQRIRSFIEKNPGWALEVDISTFPRPTHPAGSVDGGFAARLRRL